jgi:hypothetical protein
MSAELAVVEQQQGIDVGRWAETLVFAAQLAEKVHDTEFVPKALRGRPEAVAATIMYGAEVGVTPMQALSGIHIVDGRPSPSAELMRAMILRAGHTFTIHEMTGTRVRVSGLRRGRPEPERVTVEWSVDMARAAGLLGKQNWRNYPRAMLTARAFGDLARVLFPDVVKGLGYVAEDVSVDELQRWPVDGPDTAPEPPRKRLQRQQRRKVAQSVTDEPSEPQDAATPAAELPPVAPPHDPPAAVSPGLTVEDESRYDVDTPDAIRAKHDALSDEGGWTVSEPDEPPEPEPLTTEQEADRLAARRAEIAARHNPNDPYDPSDVTLPDMPDDPQPEQTPPEPPAPGVKTIAPGPLRALHAGLTRELGTVATRQEKHALVAAILGHPIESTKELTREQGYAVLDMLTRFVDGSARWRLDLATGGMTVERIEPEGGEQS